MGSFEQMLIDNDDVKIKETNILPYELSGLTLDKMILLNTNNKHVHKLEVLAEELAHRKITYGDIRDQSKILNRKFELKARRLGCEMVITLDGIIDAFHEGICNLHEMACYFEVSNNYVLKAIEHYKMKYGLDVYYKGYVIKFEPLQVYEHHNWE
ncbi:ImmA/IrrE family metallo-endopeptidase [Staphylococcus edaphicus]|uniref:ImmA/IrrE family metallo-endopeptidase n=1 Tax=Staphylococcus edaphicus TaxID=1955013 RepID=A0A2C6UAJ8_9STAP|nr:ImmA/IrrE family metallo-endopeptidase [Staphylococcus edaphicus]PHK50752.1 toxin [Staphylococcus edaphicus]UQW82441.1 ImmA/IrrE family metallo-endopeptidase [Staphylococcus edaphicus]